MLPWLQLSSFGALQDWVSCTDIQNFDILLCVGNKVDLVPGHSAHVEYRRRLQRLQDSSGGPYSEFSEYGISETEGSSLLGDEELPWEISRSCLEWCSERNIEYIEACASNADFDKCKTLKLTNSQVSLIMHLSCNRTRDTKQRNMVSIAGLEVKFSKSQSYDESQWGMEIQHFSIHMQTFALHHLQIFVHSKLLTSYIGRNFLHSSFLKRHYLKKFRSSKEFPFSSYPFI